MKLAFRKTGSGKPLFILHGLFGSSDNWQTLGKQFANYFTVYLIDIRNHGRSPHSNLFNYGVMSDDIGELMADEGIESAMILGHSMGGKAAMNFTALNPSRVEKLVVVDIGTRKYPVTNQLVIDALEQIDPLKLSSRKEAEESLKIHLADEPTRQFLLKNLYWTEDRKLNWRFNFHSIRKNILNVGEATPFPSSPVKTPVLFIAGNDSDYISRGDMENILAIFPFARLEIIPRAGHWVHADQPQLFFEAVMRFLN